MFSFFAEIIQFLSQIVYWLSSLVNFILNICRYIQNFFSSLSNISALIPASLFALFLLVTAYYIFDFIRGR